MSFKERILIVDDRRSEVWFIERILQKEGFNVLTAFDGRQGLQKAQDEKPDLIILDTVMPKMDGHKVYHHLQKDPDTARIPVLFLTVDIEADESRTISPRGHCSTTDVKEQVEGHQAKAIDFLTKPVIAEEVVHRVQALLKLSKLSARSEEVMTPKARIFIVDDNRSLVRVAERTLQKEGFDVITAFDGLDGLRKVREKKPDLVILDIIMPELNGFRVLDLVRQHTSVPVIMLTSDNELDSVKLTLALGADGYLLKPVSARELLARVRDNLRHAGVEAP